MTTPTKVAALVGPGDRVGYEGQWRTVKAAKTGIGAMGGLFVIVTWEEAGPSASVPGMSCCWDGPGWRRPVVESPAPSPGHRGAPPGGKYQRGVLVRFRGRMRCAGAVSSRR